MLYESFYLIDISLVNSYINMLLIYYQICFLFKHRNFHVMHSFGSVLCVDFLSSAYLLLCFFKKRIFFYNCSIKTKIPIDKPSYTNKTPNLKVFFLFFALSD